MCLLAWTREEYGIGKKGEIATLAVTVAVLCIIQMDYELIAYQPALATLPLAVVVFITIAAIDFKHYLIPNRLSAMVGVFSVIFVAGLFGTLGKHLLYGGAALLLIFIVFYVLSRGGLGMGDVKIAGPMGLFIGLSQVPQFLIWTFLLGSAVSIVLLLTKVRKKEDKIAFGPYMVMGFLILWIF